MRGGMNSGWGVRRSGFGSWQRSYEPYGILGFSLCAIKWMGGKANPTSNWAFISKGKCEFFLCWTAFHTALNLLHVHFWNGCFIYEMDLTCHQPGFIKLWFSVTETWRNLLDGPMCNILLGENIVAKKDVLKALILHRLRYLLSNGYWLEQVLFQMLIFEGQRYKSLTLRKMKFPKIGVTHRLQLERN